MRGFIDGEYQDGELRGLTFVAGQRGMGKTTEVCRLLKQCEGGALFFDTTGNHGVPLREHVTLSQPGELKEYLRRNRGRRFRVRYNPPRVFGGGSSVQMQHFQAVCAVVAAFGQMIFAIDEVDTYCGSEWGPDGMPPELYELAHMGRHYRVSMIVTARDPASLSIRFRSQCEALRIFRTDEDRYVRYFAARIGQKNAAQLPSLPRHKFLYWQSGTSTAEIRGGTRAKSL